MSIAFRVKETSTTTGTGNLTLAGAVSGFQSINSAFSTTNYFHCMIVHQSAAEWEYGMYVLSASTTLVRSSGTVLRSSNSDALVNFSAGTKDVFVVDPPGGYESIPAIYNGWERSHTNVGRSDDAFATSNDNLYVTAHCHRVIKPVKNLAVGWTTGDGATNKFRLGIYSVDWSSANLDPLALIATTGDLYTTANTLVSGAITGGPIVIPPGWYYSALIVKGTDSVIGLGDTIHSTSFMGSPSGENANVYSCFYKTEASWTTFPATPTSFIKSAFTDPPTIVWGDTTT